MSEGFKREGEEVVAGEDGGCFVILFVEGFLAAAVVVIIHAREIIVDEGIGVDELESAGGIERVFKWNFEHFGCGDDKEGADSFSGSKQTGTSVLTVGCISKLNLLCL